MSREDLENQKNETTRLLELLDKQLVEGKISEDTYKSVQRKYKEKLAEVELLITDKDRVEIAEPSQTKSRKKIIIAAIISAIIIVVVIGMFCSPNYIMDILAGERERDETEIWAKWGMLMEVPAGVKPDYSSLFDKGACDSSGVVSWRWDGSILSVYWSHIRTSLIINMSWSESEWEHWKSKEDVTELRKTDSGQVSIQGHTWYYESISFKWDGSQYYGVTVETWYEEAGMECAIIYFSQKPDPLEKTMKFGSTFRVW